MKGFISVLVALLLSAPFSLSQVALTAQLADNPASQTGFVVITPLSGTGEGLSVVELFENRVGNNSFQTTVLPSPAVTATAILIESDTAVGLNTGIAVVNPNDSTANLTLTMRNQQGIAVASRTLSIPPRQQISRFVNELFAGESIFSSLTGLLSLTSNVPVGVLGLSFDGVAFTSLPVPAQLGTNSVAAAVSNSVLAVPAAPSVASATVGRTSTFTNGIVTAGVTPGLTSPAVPTTIGQIPSTFPAPLAGQPVTGLSSPLTGSTGQFQTNALSPVATATSALGTPVPSNAVVSPQVTNGVAGSGTLLLPQFAIGGGWRSKITIANTSLTAQTVRIDFFNSNGEPMPLPFGSALTDVVIPAGGVVVI